jgi:hypothetical protein
LKSPFDSYYDEIIRPAAKSAGLETLKADEIYSTGPIIHDIWKHIWAATVIADVTEKNPNANHELGICHTLGVPTVIILSPDSDKSFGMMVARDGVEPTPAFSGLRSTGLTTYSINNLTRQDGRFIVTTL